MTATERIQKIKVLLGLAEPAPAPAPAPEAPAALTAYKLADGTEVEISELAVGGIVTVGGAAAPAGEHILEDGTKIVTDVSGVITEMEAGATATPPAEMTPEELKTVMSKFAAGTPEERLQNLEIISKALFESTFGWELREATQRAIKDQAIAVYKTGFEAQVKAAEDRAEKFQQSFESLLSIVEELAKAPTSDPVEPAPQRFQKEEPVSKVEKFEGLKKAIDKLKK